MKIPPMSEFEDGLAAGLTISDSLIEESVESDCSELNPVLENILAYQFPKTLRVVVTSV